MSVEARGWLVAVSSWLVLSCSGSSITDSARTIDTSRDASSGGSSGGSADASTGTSTDATTPSPCGAPLLPPQIRLEPHCASFTPALSNVDLAWVGRESIPGEPKLNGHRFTAAADGTGCGFDVVLGLPYVTFDGASGSPYQMSGWWSEDQTGSRALVAIVLRETGDQVPVLGVADASSGGLLAQLSAPVVFGTSGPTCPGPQDASAPYLFRLGVGTGPGSCAWGPGVLVQCDTGGLAFLAVNYLVPRDLSSYPALYGRSTLLHE